MNRTNSKDKESMDNALHQLFVDGLKDLLWAEEALNKNLPKMAKGATSKELKTAFENHHKETVGHIEKLKQAFKSLDEPAKAVKCKAMEGLLEEAEELLASQESGSMARDAALIVAAQKIEHYEIASYGTLATFAKLMGHKEAKKLLGEILEEEKNADSLLTEVAESFINQAAMEEE
jgi:ferritin-like metal-binding protein YciE